MYSLYAVTYVYIYTYYSQNRDAGRAKDIEKKNWDSIECRVPRKLSTCLFGYARHRFGIPDLGIDNFVLPQLGKKLCILWCSLHLIHTYIYIYIYF